MASDGQLHIAGSKGEVKAPSARLSSFKRRKNISPHLSPSCLDAATPPPSRDAIFGGSETKSSSSSEPEGVSILRLPRERKLRTGKRGSAVKSIQLPPRSKPRKMRRALASVATVGSGRSRKKPRRTFPAKSPVQAAQECIQQQIRKKGTRGLTTEVTREIVTNNTGNKPPPCPCCGNTDVRIISHLYEVGWSCIDCGEEYGYPHLTSSPVLKQRAKPGIPLISIGPSASRTRS
ncbi:hypothetical protein AAMO2058_000616300 [Amorphochlora amoebiformis]